MKQKYYSIDDLDTVRLCLCGILTQTELAHIKNLSNPARAKEYCFHVLKYFAQNRGLDKFLMNYQNKEGDK